MSSAHPIPLTGRQREAGAATVELAVATPLLLLLLLLVVQAGVWAHAAHIARAAAVQALDAAAAENTTAADGRHAGAAALRQLGGAVLTDPQISVVRDAERVQVTVFGNAASVVPGLAPPVRITVAGPVSSRSPASPRRLRRPPGRPCNGTGLGDEDHPAVTAGRALLPTARQAGGRLGDG